MAPKSPVNYFTNRKGICTLKKNKHERGKEQTINKGIVEIIGREKRK